MSCRESRRARIDELFHEYEADITKLTQINERVRYITVYHIQYNVVKVIFYKFQILKFFKET